MPMTIRWIRRNELIRALLSIWLARCRWLGDGPAWNVQRAFAQFIDMLAWRQPGRSRIRRATAR
ncbi:hypothetical protein [Thiobacillus denitrificans]|uniref:hypothetical protein n=1 Tax=Thiobacillus denitrificans TaxID=36861 RepID=UPI0003028DF9|nr:hypothetical protein [Thiobacillus denitrificans]